MKTRFIHVAALTCSFVCSSAFPQQPSNGRPSEDTLVELLQTKGILTSTEAAELRQAPLPADREWHLAKLLLAKGLISQVDFDEMSATARSDSASAKTLFSDAPVPAVYRVPTVSGETEMEISSLSASADNNADADAANASATDSPTRNSKPQNTSLSPTTISATNPLRAFPVGGLKKGELTPAIKLAGIGITPYGFLKATFIQDSSSPNGDDFPLPGFLGDSGPAGAPEFHIKARSTRFGTNFEWLDGNPNLTLTGKFEFDFEGNFNRSDNRNLSSIRSYNPSIRLAYGRLDYKLDSANTVSAVFGQDWTPFGSSTLPNMLETTAIGIGFGDNYERAPQFRFGYTHDFGTFQLMPEMAVVLPAVGDTPSAANIAQQLGYGEQQGPDSDKPQLEGRLVGQWQLDHAPGVSPAQIIFSFEEGHRTAIVLGSAVPAAYKAAFPTGATVSSPTDGWDGEWQLPTRWLSLIGKFYSGSDLRYYFAGQLFSNYNDVFGLTNTASASSNDGGSIVFFGTNAKGVPIVAAQRPVRARGGLTQLGLPISRWLGRDPNGRNAGWSVYMMYGGDQANTRDLLRVEPAGSRARSDMTVGTINYKLNKWISFSFEESLYRTRANTAAAGLPLFEGMPQHEWRDLRSEGGTIFSF